MGKLTINDIAGVLVDKNGLDRREANQFVTELFAVIMERLNAGEQVKVKGLGTFKIIGVEARESVSVRTGERVTISGHSKLTFIPDATMKELVNKPFSQFETVVLNDGVEFDDMKVDTKDEAKDEELEEESEETVVEETIVEEAAVEKAIKAYQDGYYKNNPGKKIKNYSDANGMFFSSFNCIPLKNGEKVYLNAAGDNVEKSAVDGLAKANTYFFSQPLYEQRDIMRKILAERAKEDLDKTLELGLIGKDDDGLYYNIGIDDQTIVNMAENILKSKYKDATGLTGTKDSKYSETSKKCISLAI